MKKILLTILIFGFVAGCGTVSEGFKLKKGNSGDEFLVEKKSPLVMPPSYNELPVPSQKKIEETDRKSDVRSLVLGSKNKEELEETNETISSIEKLILKEIKKN